MVRVKGTHRPVKVTFPDALAGAPVLRFYRDEAKLARLWADYGQALAHDQNQPPAAGFSYSPGDPSLSGQRNTVTFSDSSVDSDGGKVVSWRWSFGDGATSTARNPVHTYTTAGNYTVSLTVKDSDGGATNATSQTVSVVPNLPPTASFSFSPDSPSISGASNTVQFTDASNDSGDGGAIVSWQWDFGDGSTANTQNPMHTYSHAGDYTVTLTVTDSDGGASNQTTQTVTISP